MYLLTRRWLLFGLVVIILAVACWRLGVWQFDRLEERRADNEIFETNLAAPVRPADDVMSSTSPLPGDAEWQRVEMIGTYDLRGQTLVRYQTRDGQPGMNVVVPLVGDDGATALVDRGWFAVTNDPGARVDPPDPPSGRVTVIGWAQPDQNGDPDEITPNDGKVRLISSTGFESEVGGHLLHGYIAARQERPAPPEELERAAPPELDSGPHFFYGLQWWFFAALAVGGFGYLAWSEARDRRTARENRGDAAN
ncbi:MAG: SURF1 family protein [Propionibacteriales bacterium]|nr:SURF1 family protein [Propionibacteriales bacterium]